MRVPLPRGVLAFFASILIRILGFTWRIEWRGNEHLERAREMSPQIIFSFWHGRLLVLSYSHRKKDIQVLGFGHVKGSTTRGGAKALRDLSSVLRRGFDIGLTVDGPKGPKGRVQQGVIELSRMTGSAVLPVSNAARPRKLFASWDTFQFPRPFAKVLVGYGEPFVVPSGATVEERERWRTDLEASLTKLTADLDIALDYCGAGVWPHEST
jgi:lysophospholipid acyltransferase (LPLAT)-like uncharacterized protein